jgi:hypothetical protein
MSDRPPAGSDEYWDFFTREAAALNASLYVRFAQGVKGDAELRTLAALARSGQPHANMLFAAVHFLLLRGTQHAVRAFYPNLSKPVSSGDPFPAFRDFCLSHTTELAPVLATRVTNTNEVGRSALLYPAFVALAKDAPQPLHLIEIGPSAGLNLYWDRYSYRYTKNGEAVAAGAPGAKLVIETPLKGDHVPPLGPPPNVSKRIGLELHPVDLANEDDRDWLKALIWPDHLQRFQRLEQALAANASWPHDIRAGDAVELLPDVLAEIPEKNGTLCLYHTMAIYQFTSAMKQAVEDMLTIASVRRPLFRLSLEWTDGAYPLALARYADGAVTSCVLAMGGAQGSWLEWQGLAAN